MLRYVSAQGIARDAIEGTPTIGEALDAFLDDWLLSGRSAQTRVNYRSCLRVLPRDEYVSAFTPALVRQLMTDKLAAGHGVNTVRTFYGAIGSFGRWCVDHRYLTETPITGVPYPKEQLRPHRYLSPDELRRIWAAADTSNKPDETRLILLLLLEGLRANELCKLRWQDVREDRIVVAFAKGNRPRAIPLTSSILALLETLPRSDATLFHLSTTSLYHRIRLLGRKAKVPHVHPHIFRHTWASMSLLQGASADTVRTLGGWTDNSTVFQRYVASVREDAAIRGAVDLGELFE